MTKKKKKNDDTILYNNNYKYNSIIRNFENIINSVAERPRVNYYRFAQMLVFRVHTPGAAYARPRRPPSARTARLP